MKKDTLRKTLSGNADLNRFQDLLAPRFNAIATDALLNRQELTASFAAAGTLEIPHRLGYVPAGWIVTDKTTAANVWRVASTSATITLSASAAVDVLFFVF